MKSLFGVLIVCGLFSCRFSKHEWIKIEGIAKDARAGAVVVTDDNKTYYISGKKMWGYRSDNRVKVKGYLQIIKYPNNSNDSIYVSQLHEQSIIHHQIIRIIH